jgi:uncharacterized protein (DUF433 family)
MTLPVLSEEFEMVRSLLTLKEAALLSGARESLVRKDVENRVLRPLRAGNERVLFRWADVYLMAAVYSHDHFNRDARKHIVEKLEVAVCDEYRKEHFTSSTITYIAYRPAATCVKAIDVRVNSNLVIPFGSITEELAPVVRCYASGLSRSEERNGLLGGEPVFRGSRLSVRHIGKLRAGGESIEDIRLDYPYITESDIDFAEMYYKAHPAMGRPRIERGGSDGRITAR